VVAADDGLHWQLATNNWQLLFVTPSSPRLQPLLQGVLVRRRGVALGRGGGAAGLGADVAGGLARALLYGALVRVSRGLVWQRDADLVEGRAGGLWHRHAGHREAGEHEWDQRHRDPGAGHQGAA